MDKCSDSTADSSDDEPLSKFTRKRKTDDLSNGELDSQPDSDDSTGDSSDDEPLSKLIKKSQTDELSNTTQSEKDDDKPIKKKTVRISLPVTPGKAKGNKRGGTKTEKTAERTAPLPLKKRPVNRARKNSSANQRDKRADSTSDSSDDNKPSSKMVKNRNTRAQRKTRPSAARKSPRKAPNKRQRSGESWDSSDDEPVVRTTRRSPGRRRTVAAPTNRGRRTNGNRHKGNKLRKDEEEEDSDEEPLIRPVRKPRKKTRATVKATLVPENTVASRKRSVNRAVGRKKAGSAPITRTSDRSSDDEPLIKVVKNASDPGNTTAASTQRPARRAVSLRRPNVKERSRRNIKPVQYASQGSSNDDSADDEPRITKVKKPTITKTPLLELERIEDAFENYNKGSTSKICGGTEESPADELLVKMTTSPPEPLADLTAEERGKREVNCDKEP